MPAGLARRRQSCRSMERGGVVEDHLTSIFHLCARRGGATTSTLAGQLGPTARTVSAVLERLEAAELDRRSPEHVVELTENGRRHAVGVVRPHRLLEDFPVEVLDVPWDEVHDEAEVPEHALSARLEERIDATIGRPTQDPHGDPVPPARGQHVAGSGLVQAVHGRAC